MSPLIRKALGVFCALMCVGAIVTYPLMAKKSIGTSLLLAAAWGWGAIRLLYSKKNVADQESIIEQANREPVDVSISFSILVYVIDVVLIILLMLILGFLSNTIINAWLRLLCGLFSWIIIIFVAITIPGPKRLKRIINKRKRNSSN